MTMLVSVSRLSLKPKISLRHMTRQAMPEDEEASPAAVGKLFVDSIRRCILDNSSRSTKGVILSDSPSFCLKYPITRFSRLFKGVSLHSVSELSE